MQLSGICCREWREIMSVLINKDTKVICQGFTGSEGTFHSEQALPRYANGRRRNAGQNGTTRLRSAGVQHRARSSRSYRCDRIRYLRPSAVLQDSITEAIDAGIKLIITITERYSDSGYADRESEAGRSRRARRPGLCRCDHPGECKIGIMRVTLFISRVKWVSVSRSVYPDL